MYFTPLKQKTNLSSKTVKWCLRLCFTRLSNSEYRTCKSFYAISLTNGRPDLFTKNHWKNYFIKKIFFDWIKIYFLYKKNLFEYKHFLNTSIFWLNINIFLWMTKFLRKKFFFGLKLGSHFPKKKNIYIYIYLICFNENPLKIMKNAF